MKIPFETLITFKGFDLYCTGTYTELYETLEEGIVIDQVYLSETDIEIVDSLSSERYDELKKEIAVEICNQYNKQ
jgi:hypothetical protein